MLIVLRKVFCLQNLICLLFIFADQVFIDTTFSGVFVCGPLQSMFVLDRKKTKLFAVCFSRTLPHRFFRFAPYLTTCDLTFFLIQKGRRSAWSQITYFMKLTEHESGKNIPKSLLCKLAGVLYLLRTSDVSNRTLIIPISGFVSFHYQFRFKFCKPFVFPVCLVAMGNVRSPWQITWQEEIVFKIICIEQIAKLSR